MMTNRSTELVTVLLTIILSASTIWLATYNPLWEYLEVGVEHRGALTIAATIAVILTGFLLTIYSMQTRHTAEISKIVGSFSSIGGLTIHPNGAIAMQRLKDTIPDMSAALNTIIDAGDPFQHSTASVDSWNKKRLAAIKKGDVVFHDVFNREGLPTAEKWVESLKNSKANYRMTHIDCNLNGFLNFIVLTRKSGDKEVWFGWIVSASHGFEQPCVQTTNPAIVQLFEDWHGILCARA